MRRFLKAESLVAAAIIGLSVYFMVYATDLPIGWNGKTGGPGGGAFPFWLSAIMALAAAGVLFKCLRDDTGEGPFFDPDTVHDVGMVAVALLVTIALIPVIGSYLALPLFMVWYLRIFGKHGWSLTAILALVTPIFLFFFFELTLKILLPKGMTESLFIPLYAMFF